MNTVVNEPLKHVLAAYNVGVNKITLETYKENRAVWWVDTNLGKKVLKKMPMGKKRLLFVLSATEHLATNGINLPKIIKTKNKMPFVEFEGTNYVLCEAVASQPPSYDVSSELTMIMQNIARFHQASRGFQPPMEAKIRSHLGIWPKAYLNRINDMKDFQKQAAQNRANRFNATYLKECKYFIELADNCLSALSNSPYSKLVKAAEQTVTLCHHDFAARNFGLTKKQRLYIFDLDDVTYDLPARDIRKFCNEVMKKRGQWSPNLLKKMLRAYHSVNPLTPEEYEVLFIDMCFPYLFYSIVNKYYVNRPPDWPEQKYLRTLIDTVNTEKSKLSVLNKFLDSPVLEP